MASRRYQREISAAGALVLLLLVVALRAPTFFTAGNLRDLAVNNVPVLVVAVGMTLVLLVGEIDISVGSQFAVCSVVCGWLAKAGVPPPGLVPIVMIAGGSLGMLNGALIGLLGLPSIIVTLAMLVALRDGLRWITEGAWVQGLPLDFQWFGLSQSRAQLIMVIGALAVTTVCAWLLRNLAGGRTLYAVGSDAEAARLAGIDPRWTRAVTFVVMGSLVGLAAVLNAVRFSSIPGNAGAGLELKAIAAVVVGGTAITGGRGTLVGTLVGVALLGTIGTALTFVGIDPFWERAIQGGIILLALLGDVVLERMPRVTSRAYGVARAR